jgi:hypothetical protein
LERGPNTVLHLSDFGHVGLRCLLLFEEPIFSTR